MDDNKSIEDKHGRRTLKTGEAVAFRSVTTGYPFQVIVSHWPSRITAAETDPLRTALGSGLRRAIESMSKEGASPFFILIGDYNDEPFSPSLAHHLFATRDRSLARRDARYFYNPFWRSIGESSHRHDTDEDGICGTHFYPRGDSTQWFTYDQVMFSSAFLASEAMVLDEQRCGILALSNIRSKLLVRHEIFDHLPVLGTVEMRAKR